MKEVENHLVVGNSDADLDRYYGLDFQEGMTEETPDTRPLCERDGYCDGCGRCEVEKRPT